MNQPQDHPEHPIDALVRQHLERQEAGVDAQQILEGVRNRRSQGHPPSVRMPTTTRSRWTWSLALAAGVLLAVLATLQMMPAQASAETLVREAQQAHALPVDRRYLLEIEPSPDMLDRFPLIEAKPENLWTRGDRFWIEVTFPDRRWAWGQDDQDRVWVACFPDRGVRFDADEIPDVLAAGLSVRTVHFEMLLATVLQDFDLTRQPGSHDNYVVRAELKPGHAHPTLRYAELEIEADTKVVKRLVLQRTFRGQDIARVTFTLAETGTQPDEAYRLEGHLADGAQVLTRDHRRQQVLTLIDHFGPHFGPQLRSHLRSLLKK